MSFYTIKYYLPDTYNPERWDIEKEHEKVWGDWDIDKVEVITRNNEIYWRIIVKHTSVIEALTHAIKRLSEYL